MLLAVLEILPNYAPNYARSAAAEEGCTNRTCFASADLIYFCRKYTIFTKFYEFMLQKVLKFANYALAVLV